MCVLVRDHIGDTLELGVRRLCLVDEERRLAERDRAQVFHRARREVRDGEQVQLVTGIRQPVVLLEELQRCGADGLAEDGETSLAGDRPHPKRRLADHHRRRRLELADDVGHEIRRHRDGVGEANDFLATLHRFRHDRGVRDGDLWRTR